MDNPNDSRALVRNQLQVFHEKTTRLEEERWQLVLRLEEVERQQRVTTGSLLDDYLLPASEVVRSGLSATVHTKLDVLFDTALDEIAGEYENAAATMDEIRQAAEENAGQQVAKQFVKPLPGHTYHRSKTHNGYVFNFHVNLAPKVPEPLPGLPSPDTNTNIGSVDALIATTPAVDKAPTPPPPPPPLVSASQPESVASEATGSLKRPRESAKVGTIVSPLRGQKRPRPSQPSQPIQSIQVGTFMIPTFSPFLGFIIQAMLCFPSRRPLITPYKSFPYQSTLTAQQATTDRGHEHEPAPPLVGSRRPGVHISPLAMAIQRLDGYSLQWEQRRAVPSICTAPARTQPSVSPFSLPPAKVQEFGLVELS